MSVNPDNDGVSYADHDVHHIKHQVNIDPSTGGDDITEQVKESFEITERGLDPDELAELRAMRVTVGAVVSAGEPQDSRGEFSFSVDAGFNMDKGETINDSSLITKTDLDPDGDNVDELTTFKADTDEVGQIYTLTDNINVGFDDDTNGNGAGGHNNITTETIDMNELFGSGPYVDAADDFNSIIKLRPDNVIELVGVQATYSLYYNVMEVEGGRTRFGR